MTDRMTNRSNVRHLVGGRHFHVELGLRLADVVRREALGGRDAHRPVLSSNPILDPNIGNSVVGKT